jgi:signal transduction histidine kinase
MSTGGILLFGVVLVLLVGMSWRSAERLETVGGNLLSYVQLAQHYGLLQERYAFGSVSPSSGADPVALDQSATLLRALAQQGGHFSHRTGDRLERAAALLLPAEPPGEAARERFARALRTLGTAVREEVGAQQALLRELRRDQEHELRAALAIAAILPLLAAAFWFLFRRMALRPLADLGSAMDLMARRDFRKLDLARTDPVTRPLLAKYNRAVGRMQDLETAHRKRETALREELESTTRALLQQQALLARADRLAVSGDMAARMAHRLRSPLSAVMATLSNLLEETAVPDHRRRLRVSLAALQRGLDDLGVIVDEARSESESPKRLALGDLVEDLFLLVSHLTPDGRLFLENRVPDGLVCSLPEAGTRHALMHLLANAIEAQQGSRSRLIRVSAERRDGRIRIAVLDQGPGFPESELKRARAGAAVWDRQDSRLGLAVVRRFADHLQGKLSLENPPGGGARATLIIPQDNDNG